jgi:hypothetical protein
VVLQLAVVLVRLVLHLLIQLAVVLEKLVLGVVMLQVIRIHLTLISLISMDHQILLLQLLLRVRLP